MLSHNFYLIAEDNKLSINFLDFHSSEDVRANKAGLAAMGAILLYTLNIDKTHFQCVFSEAIKYSPQAHILINGNVNIILTLNFLLNTGTEMFKFKDPGRRYEKDYWQAWYAGKLIECIDGKDMVINDKILFLIREHLDKQYKLLKQEDLVIKIKEKPVENYGNDLLKHPFYQTLYLLMEDYQARCALFKSAGDIDRMHSRKPEQKDYDDIYKKYINSVPACYCDMESKIVGYNNAYQYQQPIRKMIKIALSAKKMKQTKDFTQENKVEISITSYSMKK